MKHHQHGNGSSPLPPTRSRRSSSVWDYEQSIMFGQYREDLANFALEEAEKLHKLRDARREEKLKRRLQTHRSRHRRMSKAIVQAITHRCKWNRCGWFRSLCNFGGDTVFFTTLAITVAILSFVMDRIVHQFHHWRHFLVHEMSSLFGVQFAAWIGYMLVLVLLSAIVTRYCAPQSAGSGVAEMKVILRGVVLKEYLSFKTLVTKLVGETLTLASGIYLGKEGPFVHISSMCANQYMKIFYRIKDAHEYESRFFEVMAVACGLGVAVTFAAPIGGVLYSIEIVSVFFSVRSYWHGFFAATIGALFWRLCTVWCGIEPSISPIFKTAFRLENPYETLEMISFALLGLLCGLLAAAYIALNRAFVLFNRRKNPVNAFLNRWPLLYPTLVTVAVALVTFPGGFGQYFTSELTNEQAIRELFSNYTWYPLESSHDPLVDKWHTAYTSVFVNTGLFVAMNVVLIAICATLPISGGLIVPSFKIGAGLGRFFGESMAWLFPAGLNPAVLWWLVEDLTGHNSTTPTTTEWPILAGTYAVVGSAAFAGANTGAMSSAMIAFETTGQITHLMPVLVATLVATITARYFGPSIYDSMIIMKRLPYLPPILPSNSSGHSIFVEDFMHRELLFVWSKCTYRHLRRLLTDKPHLRLFPFVKSPRSMILLGTVERAELQYLLDTHLSRAQIVAEFRRSTRSLASRGSESDRPPSSPSSTNGQNATNPLLSRSNSQRFAVCTIPEQDEDEIIEHKVCSATWEEEQLDLMVDFCNCPIEPAPFQLMEGTSLIKVHNLFSLMGLNLAYVTSLGTLVGVVTLTELGRVIDDMNEIVPPTNRNRGIEVNDALSADDDDDDDEYDIEDYKEKKGSINGLPKKEKKVTIAISNETPNK